MRIPLLPVFILLMQALPAAESHQQDSIRARLENIERLLGQLHEEVRALKQQTPEMRKEPGRSDSSAALAEREPLAADLLSRRQKALYRAAVTPYRKLAMGFSFSPILPFAFDLVHWFDTWGYKAELGALWQEGIEESVFGARMFALRTLHRFSFFSTSPVGFHLYGFGGAGLNSKTTLYIPDSDPGPQREVQEQEYEEPDITMEMLLGAGVEIALPFAGGVTFAPDVGYKASYFFSRFQDSPSWKAQDPARREAKPGSDFSLGLHFAGNLYFYFR